VSARHWYVGQQGRRLGPYGESVLKALAKSQKLHAEDLLWTEGMREWVRADAVAELALFSTVRLATPEIAPAVAVAQRAADSVDQQQAQARAQGAAIASTQHATPSAFADPAFARKDPPAPSEHRAGYLLRHWRGELSLPMAYWVNQVLLSVLVLMLLAWLPETDLIQNSTPFLRGLWSLGVVLFVAILGLWQIVGVIRSAQAHPSRGGSRGWAVAAQVVSVLGILRLAGTLAQEAPIVVQAAQLIFHGDIMQASTLRVLNHGTEVEVAGGLAFGTAQKLETLLDATPTIQLVQLNNIGGWVSEGAALEKVIEMHHLSTYTRGACVSACLLAFMGGQERYLARQGKLGFHEASVSGVGGDVASEGNNQFRQVFASKGLPTPFINRALATPPSSMWYPTQQELLDAHVITAVVNEADYATTGVTEWKNEAALRKQFDDVPVFAAVQNLDPTLYVQLRDTFVSSIHEGISQTEMSGRMRTILSEKIIPKYVPIGPDTPLIAYVRVQMTEMRELRERDPKYCTMFLFPTAGSPDLSAMLSSATREADIKELASLLTAVAEKPASVPSEAAVKPSLFSALRSAERQRPGTIDRVANPDKWKSHPADLCDAELMFYGAVVALPPKQAGPVLRYLMASAFSETTAPQATATQVAQ
jgi:hypothetical protein